MALTMASPYTGLRRNSASTVYARKGASMGVMGTVHGRYTRERGGFRDLGKGQVMKAPLLRCAWRWNANSEYGYNTRPACYRRKGSAPIKMGRLY